MMRPRAPKFDDVIAWAAFAFTAWLVVAPLAFLVIAAVSGGHQMPVEPVKSRLTTFRHVYGSIQIS